MIKLTSEEPGEWKATEIELPDKCPGCGADVRENLGCWQWVQEQCAVILTEDGDIEGIEPGHTHAEGSTRECDYHCLACNHAFGGL